MTLNLIEQNYTIAQKLDNNKSRVYIGQSEVYPLHNNEHHKKGDTVSQ